MHCLLLKDMSDRFSICVRDDLGSFNGLEFA